MKGHQVSEQHLLCTARATGPMYSITETVTETPLMTSIQKLNNLQRKNFLLLFNIAYKIAKYGKPFSDFKIDCQLIEQKAKEP